MTSRTLLIMALVVILALAVGCGTPASTATEGLHPTHASPPPTGSAPTAVLQPTETSPPPTEPPSMPPTALTPAHTPQPPTATATPVLTAESTLEGAQVTFASNAGFLIAISDKKVLIKKKEASEVRT